MNNLHPTIKLNFENSTQEISFLDMKNHIGADHRLSTTLYRKLIDHAALLHFHSNHSLKCKESIVFSQALTFSLQMTSYCKKNSIPLQYLSLPENTSSLATSPKLSSTPVTLFSTETTGYQVP